jgi:crotonobetainyl-CoA:carnitine CoA-transferase CaiB-like acyl-CoA transferase
LESVLEDPHLKAVGFFRMMTHPSEGQVRMMAPTGQWSESPSTIRRPAPRMGEHSAEVLAQSGYTAEQIQQMVAAGVTQTGQS